MSSDLRKLGDPGSTGFHLEAYPFYQLNRLVSRYNIVIEGRLRTIGIDIPTWRVLMILGESQPRPVAYLAKCAVINISTMVRIIERMTEAGLIQSLPSSQDGRVTEIVLTPLGQEKLNAARKITAPVYRRLIHNFDAREFSQLLESIKRLHDNLEAPDSPDAAEPAQSTSIRKPARKKPATTSRARSRS
jgi:DNA-binding MarR family transcriptional regulator